MAIGLLLAFFVAACGGDEAPTATPVDATPAAGGMVLPTTVADTAQAESATPTPALLIGDAVQVLPDQQLRLYTDATTDALVMNLYPAGERFTLLDASGDYAAYPVEQEDKRRCGFPYPTYARLTGTVRYGNRTYSFPEKFCIVRALGSRRSHISRWADGTKLFWSAILTKTRRAIL
jgi:hypothetical protein